LDLTHVFWLGLCKVVLINLVLSGDNAVVLALACRHLPPKARRLAYLWGSLGAVALMLGLAFAALSLLKVPLLQAVGGLLLLAIAFKLQRGEGEKGSLEQAPSLWAAVKTIIVADVVMSLDNTVAVAAAAKGDMLLIGLGLTVSVPMIIWGAGMLTGMMQRYPAVVKLGAILLGYTAGEMLVGDQVVGHAVERFVPTPHLWVPVGVALFVLLIGEWTARRVVTVKRYSREELGMVAARRRRRS
jgi:YjbE family integral membrane protein